MRDNRRIDCAWRFRAPTFLLRLLLLGAVACGASSSGSGTGGSRGSGGATATGGATARGAPSSGGSTGSGGTTGSGGVAAPAASLDVGDRRRRAGRSARVARRVRAARPARAERSAPGGNAGRGGSGSGGSATGGSSSGGAPGTGGAAGGGAAVPSAGCGKTSTLDLRDGPGRNGQRDAGRAEQRHAAKAATSTITSGGQQRGFAMRLPDNYDNTHPYGLIFAFHWNGGNSMPQSTTAETMGTSPPITAFRESRTTGCSSSRPIPSAPAGAMAVTQTCTSPTTWSS